MAIFNRKKNSMPGIPPGSALPLGGSVMPEGRTSPFWRAFASRPKAAPDGQDLHQLQAQRMAEGQGMRGGVMNGFKALTQVIGKEQVQKANSVLQKYKEGKVNLERKIVENEQWYKLRHWEQMRDKEQQVQPVSGWLFNCIANKHADAMDNYPSPNILPREEGDKAEAEMLTSILPVILDQNDFEETYDDVQSYRLKTGSGAYGVFWDSSKLGGLGDISIQKVDLINLFWEAGKMDIQKSRNVYHVELMDNDLLIEQYPQLEGRLGSATFDVTTYVYDDKVDTTDKSLVVDWYYKKRVGNRTVLHYCKYVNDEVLYATENDPAFADRGWYDHGLYPFVIDPLFKIEGTIAGFGYIDVGKDTQAYIDRGNQAIMKNMLANAGPRNFAKQGAINEEEYTDLSKDIVHVEGDISERSIRPIEGKTLSDVYVQVVRDKIDELKETTGNRDVSNGGTTGGVTAASGLAAMQEAGSKLSRDKNKASYRAFRKVCYMVIELIRQFYNTPRKFRIIGENGAARYETYSNKGIRPRHQGFEHGIDMGYRIPLFDIEITAQKQSPYSKMSQNELALQFYNAGFFNPQMADQALACLDMMDFDRKHFIMQKIQQNGTLLQMLQAAQQQVIALASVIDKQNGTKYAEQFAAQMAGGQAPSVMGSAVGGGAVSDIEQTEALGGKEGKKEAHTTRAARQRVAESTDPT